MDNPLFRFLYSRLRPDEPCPHMRLLVSDYASGVLGGTTLVYTRSHLGSCPRCRLALEGLQQLQARLHALESNPPALDEDRRAQVMAEWERIEQTPTP